MRPGGRADSAALQLPQRFARPRTLFNEIGGFDLQQLGQIIARQMNELVGDVVAHRGLRLLGVFEKNLRPLGDAEHVGEEFRLLADQIGKLAAVV